MLLDRKVKLTFTAEGMGIGVLLPLLLLKSRTALGAMNSAGVMLTLTGQDTVRAGRIQVAVVRMSVTHATTSDGHVLDRVEVTTGYRRILSGH